MDREKARSLCDEARELLAQLEEKHGVKVAIERVSFTDVRVMLKLELAEVSTNGVVQTREAESYRLRAVLLGLPLDGLGRRFLHQGRSMRIIGLTARPSDYPVIAEDLSGGNRLRFPVAMIKCLLQGAAAEKHSGQSL